MNTPGKWVVVRVDGKIASVSTDYSGLADTARILSSRKNLEYKEICATVVSDEEIWKLRKSVSFDDLVLFGSPFRKRIWKALFSLTHPLKEETGGEVEVPEGGAGGGIEVSPRIRMMSYSDFAQYCGCPAGVRAVAHAVGMNPLPVLIPCHLIVPKETMDRIKELRRNAEQTLFKGEDLFPFRIRDYG
ncbi:MAG: methylated-DNA--[protein]-cysteine S-methyltransferase, partial [Candidatus Cryptobacteroides sp.]